MFDITIFIRARNEGSYIKQCLESIFAQECSLSYEVVLLDCESSDDTVAIAKQFNISIYSIAPQLFSYSAALNFGASVARGKLFVSLSAHAIPANKHWLKELVSPLINNPEIIASYSRQIGWQDISEHEQQQIEREFLDQPFVLSLEQIDLKREIYPQLKFSNVSSCIKTEYLINNGFKEILFAEDRLFALESLLDKYQIYYASNSKVFHSHAPNFKSFRTVACKATRARRQIDFFASTKLKSYQNSSLITQSRALYQLIRIARLSAAVAALILWQFFTLSKRKREFLRASIGTSIGKFEALNQLFTISDLRIPKLADPKALLALAKKIKELQ